MSTSSSLARCRPACRRECRVSAGSARRGRVEKLLAPDLAPHVRVSRIVTASSRGDRPVRRHDGAAPRARPRATRRNSANGTGRASPCDARHRVAVPAPARWAARSPLARALRAGRQRLEPASAKFEAFSPRARSRLRAAAHHRDRGILDARAFALMPVGHVLNVARGAHIVEPDLIAAVRSGHLSGAALESRGANRCPPTTRSGKSPGHDHAAHRGAAATETIADQFVASVRALARGEAFAPEIDRRRGY